MTEVLDTLDTRGLHLPRVHCNTEAGVLNTENSRELGLYLACKKVTVVCNLCHGKRGV